MKKIITKTLQIRFLIDVLILGGRNSGISLYVVEIRSFTVSGLRSVNGANEKKFDCLLT